MSACRAFVVNLKNFYYSHVHSALNVIRNQICLIIVQFSLQKGGIETKYKK